MRAPRTVARGFVQPVPARRLIHPAAFGSLPAVSLEDPPMLHRLHLLFSALMLAAAAFFAVAPAEAGVSIRVNLSNQTLTATTPDGEVRNWAISSGRTGFRTIRGAYRPTVMKTYHWSRKYGGHMPHAIFFKGGFAIHGTTAVSRLGAPASHGCVRLHPAAARELFHLVKKHGAGSTRIAINGVAPDTGRSMLARAKAKPPQEMAQRRQAPRTSVAPAYAPPAFDMPAHRVFQRLR
jgi:L,D-transpeptidase catalytic domain